MKRGFTLVELLIVMAILAILVTAMVGALNPAMLVNKANDARRKKDLNRIKVSLEEYYNDNGCYPNGAALAALKDPANCFQDIDLFPQLKPWVCDPVTKVPYIMVVDPSSCPTWYKIYTKLMNPADVDIPQGWQYQIGYHVGGRGSTPNDSNIVSTLINYGVSSANVSWSEAVISDECDTSGNNGCNYQTWDSQHGVNVCNAGATDHCLYPDNCYAGPCKPECKVACCPAADGLCH